MLRRALVVAAALALAGCAYSYSARQQAAFEEGQRRAAVCDAKPTADEVIACYQDDIAAAGGEAPQTALFFLDLTQSLRNALRAGEVSEAEALETFEHVKRQALLVYQLEREQRAQARAALAAQRAQVRAQQQQALAQSMGLAWSLIQQSAPQPSALRFTNCRQLGAGISGAGISCSSW